jgi:hypothetical protein
MPGYGFPAGYNQSGVTHLLEMNEKKFKILITGQDQCYCRHASGFTKNACG